MTSLNTTSTDGATAAAIARQRMLESALPALAAVALLVYALTSSGYLVTVVGFAMIYAVFCLGLNS
jgi:branched-chain amino acid transport system permease protein